MSTPSEIHVEPGAEELARAVAERLVLRLVEVQREGRTPVVALTGGSIAVRLHRAVLDVPQTRDVDWSRVDIWWGDERFVPAGDPDRNAVQAREAFLSALPVDEARIHEMPASDGPYGDDVDAAAEAHAAELEQRLGRTPRFDVIMLGIGPDGHCASLFPGHPEVLAEGLVVAVRDSPKPPPTRISFTMDLLRKADDVWFVASGDAKAEAVRNAVSGDRLEEVPASGPAGRERTLWMLDEDAASLLPSTPPPG